MLLLRQQVLPKNLRLISSQAESALCKSVMDYAFNGTDMFEGQALGNIAAIGTLYPEVVQIAASAESAIKSVADMKGKRVSVSDAEWS